MAIDIKIKVKNDNSSYTQDYDRDEILVGASSEELRGLIAHTMEQFNQPVEETIVKVTLRSK